MQTAEAPGLEWKNTHWFESERRKLYVATQEHYVNAWDSVKLRWSATTYHDVQIRRVFALKAARAPRP